MEFEFEMMEHLMKVLMQKLYFVVHKFHKNL